MVGVISVFLVLSALVRGFLSLSETISHKEHIKARAQRFIDRNCDAESIHDTDAADDCHRRLHIVEQDTTNEALAEALEPWGVATWLISQTVLVIVVLFILTGVFFCIKFMERQRTQFEGPIIGEDPKKRE